MNTNLNSDSISKWKILNMNFMISNKSNMSPLTHILLSLRDR